MLAGTVACVVAASARANAMRSMAPSQPASARRAPRCDAGGQAERPGNAAPRRTRRVALIVRDQVVARYTLPDFFPDLNARDDATEGLEPLENGATGVQRGLAKLRKVGCDLRAQQAARLTLALTRAPRPRAVPQCPARSRTGGSAACLLASRGRCRGNAARRSHHRHRTAQSSLRRRRRRSPRLSRPVPAAWRSRGSRCAPFSVRVVAHRVLTPRYDVSAVG